LQTAPLNRNKEAGSRKQEAGSRKQEAGSRKQEAGSRKQEAGSSIITGWKCHLAWMAYKMGLSI